jgi:hypothetical protein
MNCLVENWAENQRFKIKFLSFDSKQNRIWIWQKVPNPDPHHGLSYTHEIV